MEMRELRYFVAVAEELHFGRAAEQLGIAQPALSRALAGLERRLGVALVERSSRRVRLTDAGTVLLTEARVILAAAEAAERRTREAAEEQPRIALAVKAGTAGELLAKVLDAYAAHPGACPVDLLLCEAHEQRELLCSGRADLALLHLPFDAVTGLDSEALLTEGQVVVLPGGHTLAGRTAVRQAEVTAAPGPPPARWPAPDGSCPEGPGVAVRNLTQLFQLIALGRATVVLPASAAVELRRDLVAVPVTDAPPVTTVLAWRPESRSRPVADLVRVATSL